MDQIDSVFVKRLKSFVWRAAMMGVAAAAAYVAANLDILQLSPTVTAVLGLILGEVSKWLNTSNA